MARSHAELLNDLAQFKDEFRQADRQFPDLHHAVLRGDALEDNHNLQQVLIGGIAWGSPVLGPSSYTPPYQYFYGHNLDGLKRLRSLASDLIRLAVEQLHAFRLRAATEEEAAATGKTAVHEGVMPAPVHYTLQLPEVEHDWIHWMRVLGRAFNEPRLIPQEDLIKHWKNDQKKRRAGDCPPGDYLALPNGKPVGRGTDDTGKLHVAPEFRSLLQAVRAGTIGKVTIFPWSVFAASAVAVDYLVDRIRNHPADRRGPKKTRLGRPTDTNHAADRRLAEAWDTKAYETIDDLARAHDMTGPDARRALDRHRKRAPNE